MSTKPPIISIVKKACGSDVLYFYGGGVKTPEMAAHVIRSGADGVQIGNAFEESDPQKMKKMVDAVKKEGRKKI